MTVPGAWREKTQVVWSKRSGELVRRAFKVWDIHPELGLDFLWEPRGAIIDDSTPLVASGPGTLTWYKSGAPSYDRRFTYKVFKGVLEDGRAEGRGVLAERGGRSYTGGWHQGLMSGQGVLHLSSGDRYDGEFVAGLMEGRGTYISADGSVYRGTFRAGKRDGTGIVTAETGRYETVWRDGMEIERRLVESVRIDRSTLLRLAAASETVTMRVQIDQQRAAEQSDEDPDVSASLYEAESAPGQLTIHLASKDILATWKGNAEIGQANSAFLPYETGDGSSVAVPLKISMQNNGSKPAEITSAVLDVTQSTIDPTPYLRLLLASDRSTCEPDSLYNPDLEFINNGWTGIKQARVTYTLGKGDKRTGEATVAVGDFPARKVVSIVPELRRLGVDVDRLKRAARSVQSGSGRGAAAFVCERKSREISPDEPANSDSEAKPAKVDPEIEACVQRIKRSGVFGGLNDFVYVQPDDTTVYTDVKGRIEYRWTEATGKTLVRTSPISISIPLIGLEFAGMGEMGCESPIRRKDNAQLLPLDSGSRKIELPKSWHVRIAPGAKAEIKLSLDAAKSSQHRFRLVVKLADGREVTSPDIALSYFRPRL